MKKFSVIVSVHFPSHGIGKDNQLPWKIKEDMAFFKTTTTKTTSPEAKNVVIMGRKTWDSLPSSFRPLPDRINMILSRNTSVRHQLTLPDEVLCANSLDEALQSISSHEQEGKFKVEKIYIIGGEALYKEAIQSEHCESLFVTEVHGDFEGFDTFFPFIPAHKYRLACRSEKKEGKNLTYFFTEYEALSYDVPLIKAPKARVSSSNPEEMQYLSIIDDILKNGVIRGDRTGTGTISKFGVQMRFSLRDNVMPLITTKKVFWRGVAEELLWFVSGTTNSNLLRDKNIHIWDGNGSKQFLDSRGLHDREEGDLGPVYGFQWRHFGAEYKNMHTDYTGHGIDQLKDCIDKIKNSPEDRRIVMTAWNPSDLHLMALPPCHMFCQFYVANGELSCHMYQRSADLGLGIPFNIASYSLLTCMVAQVCGLKPGDFVHSIGDAHVYLNHVDALNIQIERNPKPFPKIYLNESITDIDGFTYNDFRIEGYNPDASIKMTMAV